MKKTIHIVKAFTKNKDEGNPAGIIFDADDLSDQQMIDITAQTGFSECAFIQKSSVSDYKVRFFSSKQEVNLCGHATIAFFSLIAPYQIAPIIKFKQETKAGILPVYCHKNGLIEMEQAQPEYYNFIVNKNDIAQLLHIPTSSIQGLPQIVSTGSPKLIIPIDSLQTLFQIQPDFNGISEYCKYSGARGFYPYTTQTINPESDFHARQFNPLAGINEDPVTGIAAGALGAYIKHHQLSNKNQFIIEQGALLHKLGTIFVDTTFKILVGGYAVKIDEQEVNI